MSKSDDARHLLLIELACAIQQIAEPAGRLGVDRALAQYMQATAELFAADRMQAHMTAVHEKADDEKAIDRVARRLIVRMWERSSRTKISDVLWQIIDPGLFNLNRQTARDVIEALRETTEDTKAAGAKVLAEARARGEWSMRLLAGEVFRAMIEEMLR